MLAAVRRWIAPVAALDLRSLALLRVGVGLLLMVDLALRARDLRAHYTDLGVLPRAELGLYTWRTVWTLHGLASPSPIAVAVLFGLSALLALALALGWRTRLATVGSWLLLASLQYRNPAIVYGADVLLRMLLFWGLFLPLGARWSLDARRTRGPAPPDRYVSVASLALVVQVVLIYVFSVLNRTGPTWWNGTALHDALHFDLFASALGVRLRGHEAWLGPMTHAAIWFEALAPWLALSPIATGPLRTLAVLLFVGFHGALGLLFDLGFFPWVSALAWLALLPGQAWRHAARVLPVAERASGPALPRPAWREGLAGLALAFVLLSNLSTVRQGALARFFPPHWDLPAQAVWIDQVWGLFSPDPPVYDGWYVLKGVREDGSAVNLLAPEEPVGFDRPAVVAETMNIRWREFFFRLQRDPDDPRWPAYGRWLCRSWNEAHPASERIARAYVYFVQETTPSGGQPERGAILTLLARDCEVGSASAAR